MKKHKSFGIFIFTAMLGLFLFSVGLQGVIDFVHAVQSKTSVRVVRTGTEQVRNYTREVIWVVLLNNNADTLVYTENVGAQVGDTMSIWNAEAFWIRPFFLGKKTTDRPPSLALFTGWLRSDGGLGFFFCLIGAFVFVVSVLSIKRLSEFVL